MAERHVAVPGGHLQVHEAGAGEPVVFIQTALTADELRPLAEDAALAEEFRRILYHRRGYASSSPAEGPGTVAREVTDCGVLLDWLGIDRAHLVGLSFSSAIALQFAADRPEHVHSLTLLEPPPMIAPDNADFLAANDEFLAIRREAGVEAALNEFMTGLIGPGWRQQTEQHLPGSAEQIQRDAATFFDVDIPALLAWSFDRDDAARIHCPVMHVGGTESGPWFAEVREVILRWFPEAEDVIVSGADHSLAVTHSAEIAAALSEFLRRHPV